MFENTFIILCHISTEGTYWYRLIETRYYNCLSCGDWNTVIKTLYKYAFKFGDAESFYSALNGMPYSNRPSPSTLERTKLQAQIDGDLFDYDISRTIRQALNDRKYGKPAKVLLPKSKLVLSAK